MLLKLNKKIKAYDEKKKLFDVQYYTIENLNSYFLHKNNKKYSDIINIFPQFKLFNENSIFLLLEKKNLNIGDINSIFYKVLFDSKIYWIGKGYFEDM